MTDREHVEDFLRQLATVRRLSDNTVAAYRRDLDALLGFIGREGVASLRELDSYHVRRFAAENFRQGLSPRSIARRLSAVRINQHRHNLNYKMDHLSVKAQKAGRQESATRVIAQGGDDIMHSNSFVLVDPEARGAFADAVRVELGALIYSPPAPREFADKGDAHPRFRDLSIIRAGERC